MKFSANIIPYAFAFFLMLLVPLFSYIVDPMFLLRHHTDSDKVIQESYSRYANAGLIHNTRFDVFTIGTSLTQRIPIEEFRKKKEWSEAANLAAPSLLPMEQKITLESALKHQKITTVIWGIHNFYYNNNTSISKEFPEELYINISPIQAIRFLFSRDTFDQALTVSSNKYRIENNYTKDRILKREIAKKAKNQELSENSLRTVRLLKKRYLNSLKNGNFPSSFEIEECDNFQVMHDIVVDSAKKHTDINFIFFFPPIPTISYFSMGYEKVAAILNMKRCLVLETRELKNVRFHFFDNEEWITDKLNNYTDTQHYDEVIGRYIADSIANEKHIITADNIEFQLNQQYRRIKKFRLSLLRK